MALHLNNLACSFALGPSVRDQSVSPYIHLIVVHSWPIVAYDLSLMFLSIYTSN